jgi:acyl carrier protein
MSREEFLLELDSVFELPAGTLKGQEKLEELEQWDSTAMMGFIALADTNNGARVSPRQIVNCSTIADLLSIAGVAASLS